MKTEQVNIRLGADLAAALDRMANLESLDRAAAARRLLETSLRRWQIDRAVRDYQTGAVSIGRAAEEAGLTQWELLDEVRAAQVAHPLTAEEIRRRLGAVSGDEATLPDIAPKPGGVLLVGINPAPVSVAAGHYYQGRIGRRLWRRLARLGLLEDAVEGAEDDAFAAAGHGLTDLVKRPTRGSNELSQDELESGAEALLTKIRDWQPGLVLFAFKEPAARLLGGRVKPGPCGEVAGVPAFLLSGPYAPSAEATRVDAELRAQLRTIAAPQAADESESTQTVTANDLARGQIRLPRAAKRFLPNERGELDVVLLGQRVRATYDPGLGPDRERSAVLRIGAELRSSVRAGERLVVRPGVGGVVILERSQD
jgi:TDG/mug DNA glycosylase family protein